MNIANKSALSPLAQLFISAVLLITGYPAVAAVTFQAESYDASTPVDGYQWQVIQSQAGYYGSGAVQVQPADASRSTSPTGARLDYTVVLPQGSYYVCLRAYASSIRSNWVWVGFDQDTAGAEILKFRPRAWVWSNGTLSKTQPIDIDAGTHTLNIWTYKAGAVIDQIIVTTDPECTEPQQPPAGRIDPYKLSVSAAGAGTYQVTGAAGAADPDYQVKISNPRTAAEVLAWPETDGGFTATIDALQGDHLLLALTDGANNDGPLTEVYAGGLTIKNPYTASGTWHVGQTHFHTFASDGLNSPTEMEVAYSDAGYDFIISTDHRGTYPRYVWIWSGMTMRPSSTPPEKQLLWISGSELGFGQVHMGAWGQSTRTPLQAGYDGIQSQIDTVRANGGIMAINHPENNGAYGWDWKQELTQTSGYSVIEAFNGQHPVEQVGSEHMVAAVDLADDFRQIWWIGSDDCHSLTQDSFNSYAMVVRTENPVPDQQDILAAIDAGNMYIRETADGPAIENVNVSGNVITLALQDLSGLYDVIWKKRGNETVQVDNGIDTLSSYMVQGNEGYVRAEITSQDTQKRAYTQPLFTGNAVDLSSAITSSTGTGSQNLIDNDATTYWEGAGSTGEFVIDVGGQRQVNALRLDWRVQEDEIQRFNYRIETSATGAFAGEQKIVVRETLSNRSALTVDFFDEFARYVRVVVTGGSVGSGLPVRIREAEVLDSSPARTNLYVDNLNGDDNSSGLFGSPWLTPEHAIDLARSRDTVNFIRNPVAPYTGRVVFYGADSGKHENATIRYQGDIQNLTEFDHSGVDCGVSFANGIRNIEWMYFDLHSASDTNVCLSDADGVSLRYNRIRDGSQRGLRSWSSSFEASWNLVYGNATAGMFLYGDDTNVSLFNNVYYKNSIGLVLSSYNMDVTVQNNIFFEDDGAAYYDTSSGNLSDSHNCIFGASTGNWQLIDTVEADPQFIAANQGDFRLSASSPCIDAGIDIGIFPDLLGNGAYDEPSVVNTGSAGVNSLDFVDIGAIEYAP